MPCRVCRQTGHNLRTCPLRVNISGIPSQGTTFVQMTGVPDIAATRELSSIIRGRFIKAIKDIIIVRRFILQSSEGSHFGLCRDIRVPYLSWVKVRSLIDRNIITTNLIRELLDCGSTQSISLSVNLQSIRNRCRAYHCEKFPETNRRLDGYRKVELLNLRDTNYLVYWVIGSYLVTDMDSSENPVKYMGMLSKKGSFKLKTVDGHRFYLIPHRLNIEPPYHPRTDKQFTIEPYCQINIYPEIIDKIFIDEEDKLSELNQWKFSALKLDYLLREVIKLGGKNNPNLEYVLDLHQDIKLEGMTVSEIEKDMAGIPSQMTNIT